jgi:hypothetical protein
LRLATCSTSTTATKKHVVILEPNRTELPSARRQLFRRSAPPRLETVRIRAPKLEEEEEKVGGAKTEEGNVSGQWDGLCQLALAETEKVIASLSELDKGLQWNENSNRTVSIIFANQNLNLMQVRNYSILEFLLAFNFYVLLLRSFYCNHLIVFIYMYISMFFTSNCYL